MAFDVHDVIIRAKERQEQALARRDTIQFNYNFGRHLWFAANDVVHGMIDSALLTDMVGTEYDCYDDDDNIDRFLHAIMNGVIA